MGTRKRGLRNVAHNQRLVDHVQRRGDSERYWRGPRSQEMGEEGGNT